MLRGSYARFRSQAVRLDQWLRKPHRLLDLLSQLPLPPNR